MQRLENESFEDYKARRPASNEASKAVNRAANAGGNRTSRQILRDKKRANGSLKGTYGADLMASFARRRRDLDERREKHENHLFLKAARQAVRNGELKLAA